ncbi:MAG: signal recognition particle-docking protein FtsY [Verrucomicrobiae bacterium]|nr:signal recognition particle-docking protein FtsY [Verrucomicrobiae bacterium]
MKKALVRTQAAIVSKFVSPKWDAEEMERALIAADFGPRLAAEMVVAMKKRLELKPLAGREDALQAAKEELLSVLAKSDAPMDAASLKALPRVILMIGVNGTGKTTTIAKLAKLFKDQHGKVLLAAADTFRAAAIDQIKLWGQRLHLEVVAGAHGADPAAVAHDAVTRAKNGGYTHLLIDTAGRQHTKANLMQELQKVKRVVAKIMPGAPHETWLVVDAPTGGNALSQAREFHAALHLTGLVIAKLDGTAKGGMVVAIHRETGLPIRFIGFGEGMDDLGAFEPQAFVDALLQTGSHET